MRTRLNSVLTAAKMQRLEVVRGGSEFLSHLSAYCCVPSESNPARDIVISIVHRLVRTQCTDAIRTTLISILMEVKNSDSRRSVGRSQCLSEFYIHTPGPQRVRSASRSVESARGRVSVSGNIQYSNTRSRSIAGSGYNTCTVCRLVRVKAG